MINVIADNKKINAIIEMRPIRIGLLKHLGYEGKEHLREQYLSGQELTQRKIRDKKNRRILRFDKSSENSVVVSYYPLHIWDRTFKRRRKTYPGKNVFAKKFPKSFKPIAEQLAIRYMDRIAREIDKNA